MFANSAVGARLACASSHAVHARDNDNIVVVVVVDAAAVVVAIVVAIVVVVVAVVVYDCLSLLTCWYKPCTLKYTHPLSEKITEENW